MSNGDTEADVLQEAAAGGKCGHTTASLEDRRPGQERVLLRDKKRRSKRWRAFFTQGGGGSHELTIQKSRLTFNWIKEVKPSATNHIRLLHFRTVKKRLDLISVH